MPPTVAVKTKDWQGEYLLNIFMYLPTWCIDTNFPIVYKKK